MPETRQFVVPEKSAGDRLDLFLVHQMPDWSRSQIARLIRDGLVTVESRPARKPGDVIEEINHQPVKTADDAVNLTAHPATKRTLLRIWGNGGSHYVVVDESKAG